MTNAEAIVILKKRDPWPLWDVEAHDAIDMSSLIIYDAISALEKQVGEKPFPDDDSSILACPYCRSGEYLHNADENRNLFCGQCGHRIDWGDEYGTD